MDKSTRNNKVTNNNIKGLITTISNDELEKEYRRRFWVKKGKIFKGVKDGAKHFRALFKDYQSRECFAVLFMDRRNKHIATEILFKGTLDEALFYPRELIKRILNHNAKTIVIAHNHPQVDKPEPSRRDIESTMLVNEYCKIINVVLHDHLIIGEKDHFSFADYRLIELINKEEFCNQLVSARKKKSELNQ